MLFTVAYRGFPAIDGFLVYPRLTIRVRVRVRVMVRVRAALSYGGP